MRKAWLFLFVLSTAQTDSGGFPDSATLTEFETAAKAALRMYMDVIKAAARPPTIDVYEASVYVIFIGCSYLSS